jgi:ParB/RepB/Spo0J family partition protein
MVDRKTLRDIIKNDTKLTSAIRSQVNQDHHAGEGYIKVIPLNQISRNNNNPRYLRIDLDEIDSLRIKALNIVGNQLDTEPLTDYFNAISKILDKTVLDANKYDKIEKILLLAKSIHKRGLIQPISVYDDGDRSYTIMAGERRFLAHVLLGKPSIRALVRERQGDEIDDQVGSLIENIAREDLTTSEKITYIAKLVSIHEKNLPEKSMTAEVLHEIIHESIRSCYRYLKIIRSEDTILEKIYNGDLSTIREIEEHLKIFNPLQESQSPLALTEESFQTDKSLKIIDTTHERPERLEISKRRGRERKEINLGKTDNYFIVKAILTAWYGESKINELYSSLDWNNLDLVQKIWIDFIDILKHENSR